MVPNKIQTEFYLQYGHRAHDCFLLLSMLIAHMALIAGAHMVEDNDRQENVRKSHESISVYSYLFPDRSRPTGKS